MLHLGHGQYDDEKKCFFNYVIIGYVSSCKILIKYQDVQWYIFSVNILYWHSDNEYNGESKLMEGYTAQGWQRQNTVIDVRVVHSRLFLNIGCCFLFVPSCLVFGWRSGRRPRPLSSAPASVGVGAVWSRSCAPRPARAQCSWSSVR